MTSPTQEAREAAERIVNTPLFAWVDSPVLRTAIAVEIQDEILAFRQTTLEPLPSSAHYLEHDTQAASNGVVLYFNSVKDALAFLDNLSRLASPTPSTTQEPTNG